MAYWSHEDPRDRNSHRKIGAHPGSREKTDRYPPLTGGSELSRVLAAEVKKLLDDHQFRPEMIAVGQGPGSFTGIRVGASLGQALAYGWNIPVVGIGSLWGFAPPADGPFAILVDARSGGFYLQRGQRQGSSCTFEEAVLAPVDGLEECLKGVENIASPHPELIKARFKSDKIWFETAPDSTLLAELVYERGNPPLQFAYCSSP